jgi:hypothetical protein
MKPYAIASPDYDYTSGGIKVMWGLFGHLLARGYEVYMNRYPSAKDFIGIYPEVLHGNAMNAKYVVRYILNKPGVMGAGPTGGTLVAGPKEFDKSEKLYYFSRLFGDTDDNHYLFLPILNLDIFKDQGKKRTKRGVFVGKGDDLKRHKPGAIIINRELGLDQQELADVLNECEVLYSYDMVSAMTEIARLCGCRVVYLSDYYTKDEYKKYEPGINGMSFGSDEGISLDTKAFREHYISLMDTFNKKLDRFLEETQHEDY